ncbi:MAG: hypothetical protein MPJ24_09475 [Pirellulaceae bacterium]|nr:hypothetical protein [Pirellulaceae bacterium]
MKINTPPTREILLDDVYPEIHEMIWDTFGGKHYKDFEDLLLLSNSGEISEFLEDLSGEAFNYYFQVFIDLVRNEDATFDTIIGIHTVLTVQASHLYDPSYNKDSGDDFLEICDYVMQNYSVDNYKYLNERQLLNPFDASDSIFDLVDQKNLLLGAGFHQVDWSPDEKETIQSISNTAISFSEKRLWNEESSKHVEVLKKMSALYLCRCAKAIKDDYTLYRKL